MSRSREKRQKNELLCKIIRKINVLKIVSKKLFRGLRIWETRKSRPNSRSIWRRWACSSQTKVWWKITECILELSRKKRLTDFVAVAGDAVAVLGSRVEVLAAVLAVGAVPAVAAIEAVATVPGRLVQLLVEVAAVRVSVAVARWNVGWLFFFFCLYVRYHTRKLSYMCV